MRRAAGAMGLLAVFSCSMLGSQAALAWDPFADDIVDGGPAGPPDPAPFVVPAGIYQVTDVYTGDVVTTVGATTTYTTETAHETPGTYARVVDVVRSGDDSAFDGSSFNGRARLADGRAVAGTYYEDFVLTPSGFVSVNVVFFQDDAETRAARAAAVGGSAPPSPASSIPLVPTGAFAPTIRPFIDRPALPPADEPDSPPAPRIGSAAVALAAAGPSLPAIEVLRGRPVQLWLEAFADGAPVPTRSWRLVAGTADLVSRRDGTGADPCDVVWLTLPPAGTAIVLRFEVTTDALPGRVLTASLTVAVRSPALGE